MNNQSEKVAANRSRPSKVPVSDRLPPQLTPWEVGFLVIAWTFIISSLGYLANTCFEAFQSSPGSLELNRWPYIALAAFLSGLVTLFIVRHKTRTHKVRKEDRSEVEALIQEALNLCTGSLKLNNGDQWTQKNEQLEHEIRRLREDLGPQAWTEYQVLNLKRLLVDLLHPDDLMARARSVLEELREYAEGPAFSYNADLFYRWEKLIDENISDLRNSVDEKDRTKTDELLEQLRANIKSVYEHVADYKSNWSEGSTIVSSIRICGSAGVIIFALLGVLHLLYSSGDFILQLNLQFGILHWGCLGIAGATTNVLIALRNSDEVEVGNNSGKLELWRIVLGVPLGFIAGILSFAAIKGELLNSGPIVPDLSNPGSPAYLSVVWAVGSGLALEKVFQRVRNTVELKDQ